MQRWGMAYVGRSTFPKDISEFELQRAFSFTHRERRDIRKAFRVKYRLAAALQLGRSRGPLDADRKSSRPRMTVMRTLAAAQHDSFNAPAIGDAQCIPTTRIHHSHILSVPESPSLMLPMPLAFGSIHVNIGASFRVLREAMVFGAPQDHSFPAAATKYLSEHQHKRSLERDARALTSLDPFIGALPLKRVHHETLQPFLRARLEHGISPGTINRDLAVVRRILNLSARLWRDQSDQPWLNTAPLIQMERHPNKRDPYPLSIEEERLLFSELKGHLATMALFKVSDLHRIALRCAPPRRRAAFHPELYTYGHRLRVAGIGFEDRKVLLGHKSEHVTTHYSAPEIGALIEASEKACALRSRKSPALAIVRVRPTVSA